ncbi:MAG TPA: cation diffusion facilitator family transporter, partial [Pseudomonadales bacterium]|nr:cation diffusion facilitator family transporter [Pseudomonadales bacterium]
HGPDDDHPYGHGRFETLGSWILGAVLLFVGLGIAYDSVQKMMEESTQVPGQAALLVAVISILSKEIIFQITIRIGRRLNSQLIQANAWHSRTDSFSSIVVVIGIVGAMFGFVWLDKVAALVVAAYIAKIGWDFALSSAKELVDTSLSQEDMAEIRKFVVGFEGVRDCHDLRSRKMGSHYLLDLHLRVDPMLSVSEGHHIGESLALKIRSEFLTISEVSFHVDAEDDLVYSPLYRGSEVAPRELPPLRGEVVATLRQCWRDVENAPDPQQANLHFLGGRVHVEVFLSVDYYKDGAARAQFEHTLKEKTAHLTWLGQVAVWYGSGAVV